MRRYRRSGGWVASRRDWKCEAEECTKDFRPVRLVNIFLGHSGVSVLAEKGPHDTPRLYVFGKTGFCLYSGRLWDVRLGTGTYYNGIKLMDTTMTVLKTKRMLSNMQTRIARPAIKSGPDSAKESNNSTWHIA